MLRIELRVLPDSAGYGMLVAVSQLTPVSVPLPPLQMSVPLGEMNISSGL